VKTADALRALLEGGAAHDPPQYAEKPDYLPPSCAGTWSTAWTD
jgi:hypothetical protein